MGALCGAVQLQLTLQLLSDHFSFNPPSLVPRVSWVYRVVIVMRVSLAQCRPTWVACGMSCVHSILGGSAVVGLNTSVCIDSFINDETRRSVAVVVVAGALQSSV